MRERHEAEGPPKKNPFTEQHYELMCAAGRSCAETRDLLARLKRAGLDTDPQIAENEQQADLLEGLKREFFPDRP